MPFIVYGHRRRVRVHALLGERTVDLLQTFAPQLSENLAERAPPLTAIMCRCMCFRSGDATHRVVRGISTDAELLQGNH
jgi:hypothetical protein